jgi:hypothetical protein
LLINLVFRKFDDMSLRIIRCRFLQLLTVFSFILISQKLVGLIENQKQSFSELNKNIDDETSLENDFKYPAITEATDVSVFITAALIFKQRNNFAYLLKFEDYQSSTPTPPPELPRFSFF